VIKINQFQIFGLALIVFAVICLSALGLRYPSDGVFWGMFFFGPIGYAGLIALFCGNEEKKQTFPSEPIDTAPFRDSEQESCAYCGTTEKRCEHCGAPKK
jgi:hypothetical protein